MKAIEIIFVAVFVGLPLWFIASGWHSYMRLGANSIGSHQMGIGLALVSISASMWIAVLVLMFWEDYSVSARFVAQKVSPMVLGLVNILLCIAALGFSLVWRNSNRDDGGLKRAISISGGILMLGWLLFSANPH
jgi:hypothetical protein